MSSLYNDLQIIPLISYRLDNFKKIGNNKWNFRCPICGDSKKSSKKSRGCIFEGDGGLMFSCRNCQFSSSFLGFLDKVDQELFKQLLIMNYKEMPKKRSEHYENVDEDMTFLNDLGLKRRPYKTKNEVPSGSIPLSCLEKDHAAIRYITERKIPEQYWSKIYYTMDFEKVCKKTQFKQEPRIMFPFYDLSGSMFAAQARILPPNKGIRYKINRVSGELPILYGLERLNPEHDIKVVEGPIDSLFLDNCLAMCSSGLYHLQSYLESHGIKKQCEDCTLIFDNERRNPQIIQSMIKSIDMGYKICIWPDTVQEKDINDMVLNNIDDYNSIINDNIYKGMSAKMRLSVWKRCDVDKKLFSCW